MFLRKEDVYKTLQQHLDKQPVGYPATSSGVELRLLKHLFTPDEAGIALRLSYRPLSSEAVFRGMRGAVSIEGMTALLEGMARKLVIGRTENSGISSYYLIPLVVGMFEGQLNRLTPEFLADFEDYVSDRAFGLSFLSTELPQMRTIPVGKSLSVKHEAAGFDRLEPLLDASEGPFVVNRCICRESSAMKGRPCRKTQRAETCLAIGNMALKCIAAGLGRRIEKEEALSVMRESEAEGLIFQPSNTQDPEFICACCGCCCGMLKIHKLLPRPLEFWATNFRATIDVDACTGCEICVDRCGVDAIRIGEAAGKAIVDSHRCIGCGNCVPTCPMAAVGLVKREEEVTPPTSIDELYEVIMANKKGPLAKMKLAARLMKKG